MNKNRVFFSHFKKYHFSSWYQRNIFLWKLVVALIILQKFFGKKCKHWWQYDGLNMNVIFKQVNFLNFVNILKEKWSIFSGWKWVCNSECQNLINEGNFWQKHFCKIINATRSFHKKKIFLIRTGEMIFFDIVKKYTIFVQKLITQKIFKIQKKFLHHEKV